MALKHVNAVVVGAGAGGGIVAKELAKAGLRVVLLERGGWWARRPDPTNCAASGQRRSGMRSGPMTRGTGGS